MKNFIASALIFGSLTSSASAFPIAYSENGIGSGTFAGKSFSSSQITLKFIGDTDNIDDFDPIFQNATGSAQISIAGIGVATISGANVYANHGNNPATVGISDYDSGRVIVGTADNLFSTYELDTVGPVTSTASFTKNFVFNTSAGSLVITSLGNTTFSASEIVSTVPLPASLPLFATAVLGLGALAYGRRGKASPRAARG